MGGVYYMLTNLGLKSNFTIRLIPDPIAPTRFKLFGFGPSNYNNLICIIYNKPVRKYYMGGPDPSFVWASISRVGSPIWTPRTPRLKNFICILIFILLLILVSVTLNPSKKCIIEENLRL